jgi:hypothetical protein
VEYTLTMADRCDSCGSQAFVLAKGLSGELLFCRHHYLKSEDQIKAWAYEILDETEKINEKASSSA